MHVVRCLDEPGFTGGVKKCRVGAMQEACGGVMGGETQDDRGKVVGGEMREVSI